MYQKPKRTTNPWTENKILPDWNPNIPQDSTDYDEKGRPINEEEILRRKKMREAEAAAEATRKKTSQGGPSLYDLRKNIPGWQQY